MKKLNFSMICFLISFFGMTFVIQAQKALPQNGEFRELSLQINSSASNFVPLEPIPVTFTLQNKTNLSIWGHAAFDFNLRYLEILVQKPDGSVQKIDALSSLIGRTLVKNGLLPPGAKIVKTEVLDNQLERYFGEPGQYKIKAVFNSLEHSQKIDSIWLSFTISEPTGENLAAYTLLKEQKNLSTVFFDIGIVDSEKEVQFLERLIVMYPESSYSDYARYVLSGHYLATNQNEKAEEMLNELGKKKNFVYSSEVINKLLQIKRAKLAAQN